MRSHWRQLALCSENQGKRTLFPFQNCHAHTYVSASIPPELLFVAALSGGSGQCHAGDGSLGAHCPPVEFVTQTNMYPHRPLPGSFLLQDFLAEAGKITLENALFSKSTKHSDTFTSTSIAPELHSLFVAGLLGRGG